MNTSFILFFPFAFLTTSFLPQEALDRLARRPIADCNPVTYLLGGMRSLCIGGWDGEAHRSRRFAAIVGVMVAEQTLALLALRRRLRRGG